MRAGKIARIRVNPRDCMSTVDLCKVAGLTPGSMNFSQSVSAAYATLLEMARKQGTIPRRDGFEYLDMMAELKDNSAPATRAERALNAPRNVDQVRADISRDKMDRRWNELAYRKQLTPENMSVEEDAELVQLHKDLGYPPIGTG